MRISIHHELSFVPTPGTARSVQQLLLTPRSSATQTVTAWSIEMAGMENAASFVDAFGNACHLVGQTRPEGEHRIAVSGTLETLDRHGVVGRMDGDPVPALFRRVTLLTRTTRDEREAFAAKADAARNRIALLHALMAHVYEASPAEAEPRQVMAAGAMSQSMGGMVQTMEAPGAAAEAPSAEHTLQTDGKPHQGGAEAQAPAPVQDLTHRFIALARAFDIPARFVTGYLAGEDAPASLHAWAEAYDERLGWIGFDPLLQLCPTDRHVRLAAGLDAAGTMPFRCVPNLATPEVTVIRVSVDAQ